VRRPRLSPAGAEELVNFDNFVPFGEADGALIADEVLFHAQGKPAAPMPKAAPLPPIAGLGRVRTPVPDLASVLVNTKMPVSELGKTLNQLGKAGSEMQKVMDQAFKNALTGRS
jgi:hypothetical protein